MRRKVADLQARHLEALPLQPLATESLSAMLSRPQLLLAATRCDLVFLVPFPISLQLLMVLLMPDQVVCWWRLTWSLPTSHGAILIELDPRNAEQIRSFAKKLYPDAKIELKKDLAGLDRYLIINKTV